MEMVFKILEQMKEVNVDREREEVSGLSPEGNPSVQLSGR